MSFNKLGRAAVIAAATGALVVGGSLLANAATGTPSTTAASSSSTGGGAGRGGPGGSADTPVTGDELSKVTAAVKGKDAAVTVDRVQKDPDGSYDVFGTTSGNRVRYEVSADLKTVTQDDGAGRGGHGPGAPNGSAPSGSAPNGSAPSNSATTQG